MSVMLSGIVSSVMPSQPANAFLPIQVTLFGIVSAPSSDEQPLKVYSPMDVTSSDSTITPVSDEQPSNAERPI